ncbi:uncharacterized protein J4E78_006753 [Alternaria triticimaculans]|uniref:uncharacterized protein n=1 Tax=Alternaria triticimaculans TaxID=297637 RepID=UPI0020C4CE3D|nr:uncharacterized protein J4E78_006753 [Alternaria triticimaculans]KAI4656862.1 hypothetical protein J4E78_006753 [Alternaria triticimaculans]
MKMDVLNTASSGAQIAGNLKKRSRFFSSKVLSSAIEHLPDVNTDRLRIEKYVIWAILIPFNLFIMYMFANWAKYSWVLFPNLILRAVVDMIEITMVIHALIRKRLNPPKITIPATPESLVYLLCCYNESYEEMMNSLVSLAEQQSLADHKKAIVVVCDGRVSCKGMTKTTSAHLKEDIVEHPTSTFMKEAYTAWDDGPMDIEIIKGEFRGLPIICVIKNENRGKRDGIILIRTFLNKFNQRKANPDLKMISPKLFAELSGFLETQSIQKVDYAMGIDADTRFDTKCVRNLMQTAREGEEIVGVTGYIRPDPIALGGWTISYLYQNAEYMVGQHRRRLRQSLTSGKVTCLPGCCQLLRVCEETMGDFILGKFGYYPKASDGLFRTVRSMMSEDRDHVCLVIAHYAHVRTRVNLSARAYTTAPTTPSVFVSQRRRWTLGPLTSDSLLLSRKSTGWMERASALASLTHWVQNPALLISRFFRDLDNRTIFYIVAFEYYRRVFDLMVTLISCDSFIDVVQTVIGCVAYTWSAAYVNVCTQFYTLWRMDDFRWGKTRIAVAGKEEKTHTG